ncbi:hypothetical protein GCM10010468_05210 [Actinocorallia longicatena]|uniref:Uncharacterized protein n=2 Tax=Actinocorallia longicatena TaxID=111803 RepID=A0ABP6PXE9_9ACTN
MTPGTAHAADKDLRLRTGVPVTAAGGTATCPGVPGDKDGWHFGVHNHPRVKLTSLKVTFDPGGEQTVTGFADATNAYVASERGAKLTAAKAEVDGGVLTLLLVKYIDLEGTCPGQAPPPPPQPAPQQNPPPQPQQNGNGGDNANGGGTTDKTKNGDGQQKPGKKPATATTPPAPGVTPGTTALPTLDEVDQPEIDVNGDAGTPVAAVQPDIADQPAGLGIAGFATIAMGAFLLLFGGVSGYVNWRRRRPKA